MSEKKDKPAGKPDLTLTAYNAIRQMLFYNEIHPGQKIKYKDLAGRIGVSMTPVIQALKWLEFRNIVRHEPTGDIISMKSASRKSPRCTTPGC